MTNLAPEQQNTIEKEILPLQQRLAALAVTTAEERSTLVADIRAAEDLAKRIEERFRPTANKEAAHKAYKGALETEKAFYGPITDFVTRAKAEIRKFDTAETIRINKENEIRDAKRRDAERERSEALIEKAADAEKEGKTELAEALLDQAQTPPAPKFTPPQATKKLIWKARVVNLSKLCQSIVNGLAPFTVVEVRQAGLNDFAKSYDGKTSVPGLEFYQEAATRI